MSNTNTPLCDDLVVVRRSELQALKDALVDLDNSASDEGCEDPLFVGDKNHLHRAMRLARTLPVKPVLDCLHRIDPEDWDRREPVLVVSPPEMELEQVRESAVQAIEGAAGASNLHGEIEAQAAARGLVVRGGINDLGVGCWDTPRASTAHERTSAPRS